MNKILKYVLIVLGTLALAALLYQFRLIVAMLLVSLVIAMTSDPALAKLNSWGIPRFTAQLLILALAAGVIIGIIILAGPSLTDELQRMTNVWFVQYDSFYERWMEGASWQQSTLSRLPEPSNITDFYLGADGEMIFPTAVFLTENIGTFFATTLIVLSFSLYWAQDEDNFVRILLSLFPVRQRSYVRETWRKVDRAIGMYVRQELLLGVLAAVLLGLGYWLLGTPFPTVLTLLGFIGWLIPLVGIVVVLLPVILATIGGAWWMAVVSIGYTLLVFITLRYWVKPVYLESARHSDFLIVFWIVVLGSLLGFGGYIAGPIVAVGLEAAWKQYISSRTNQKDHPEKDGQLAGIKERLSSAYESYQQIKDQNASPQLESIFNRLEESIQKVEQLEDRRFYEGEGNP